MLRADHLRDSLAVTKHYQGRQAAHTVLRGQGLFRIAIHFHHGQRAVETRGEIFQHRRQ